MPPRRRDTRERIQDVALTLFSEQGYERASLREIAERLDVTKAALYYHFKTKEDILTSVVEEVAAALDDVVAWAREQPPVTETRRGIVRRIARLIREGRVYHIMRFFNENQTAMRDLSAGEEISDRIRAIWALLNIPGGDLTAQLRSRLAVTTLMLSHVTTLDLDGTDDERAEAALALALDLVTADD
ncbi:TetR/AcrR family transcriptional regulator [Saccharothrix australiensis]|uniref:TetR family transcriptional regulator n=1 Tax=Saccharothrix australiensis TaxID=2072 RepID=A0A495W2E3_9PSEU|nr:TetR/AcrR family transcriptional regulator [Saccharothrix australiensis]RKT55639.1 TetR family transcriptional regulator [Saccharothrix australiensis]